MDQTGLATILSHMKGYTPYNLTLVTEAYRFAEVAHEGQRRASGEPYLSHPAATALKLAQLKLDAETIAAALLHDALDDTAVGENDLKKVFGTSVTFLVKGVSRLGKIHHTHLLGEASETGRDAQHEGNVGEQIRVENVRNMMLAMAEDVRVVLIKLADRLHNMETLQYLPQEKQRVISRETLEIFAPLAGRLGMGEWKGLLEDLTFPFLYPQECRELRNRIRDSYEGHQAYLERLKPVITTELARATIPFLEIHARPKHLYSLWKKLQRQEIAQELQLVYDLVALRIIVESAEHCYAALGVIHAFFTPLPGRIRDYIALPKPNGYQSLHTTVLGPEGVITEIQIRTLAMHQEAEFGIAAHWAYKTAAEGGKTKELSAPRETRFRWIRQLRKWQHAHTPAEFIESLKIDAFRDRIFVFTPKGDVIDLPESATPVDFAYAIHSELGNECMGARVNGKITSLSSPLGNGDRIEILRQKNKKPSADWLEFVKTTLARDHIKTALRARSLFTGMGRRIRSALPFRKAAQ